MLQSIKKLASSEASGQEITTEFAVHVYKIMFSPNIGVHSNHNICRELSDPLDGMSQAIQHISGMQLFSTMFVCLSWIRNLICPTGSTSKGGPTERYPTTPATRQPLALILFFSSLSPVLLSCILHQVRTLPCLTVLHIYLTKCLVHHFLFFLSYSYI